MGHVYKEFFNEPETVRIDVTAACENHQRDRNPEWQHRVQGDLTFFICGVGKNDFNITVPWDKKRVFIGCVDCRETVPIELEKL